MIVDQTRLTSWARSRGEGSSSAISDAASASNQSNTDAGIAKSNLEVGLRNARTRLSGLRNELGQLLEDDDERWYSFGFSKPSDPDTPEVPENLVITPGPAGSHLVFIDWDNALRATSYRVLIKRNAANTPELKNIIVTEKRSDGERHRIRDADYRSPSPRATPKVGRAARRVR